MPPHCYVSTPNEWRAFRLPPSSWINVDGIDASNFGTFDFLGLLTDNSIKRRCTEALAKCGSARFCRCAVRWLPRDSAAGTGVARAARVAFMAQSTSIYNWNVIPAFRRDWPPPMRWLAWLRTRMAFWISSALRGVTVAYTLLHSPNLARMEEAIANFVGTRKSIIYS